MNMFIVQLDLLPAPALLFVHLVNTPDYNFCILSSGNQMFYRGSYRCIFIA